MLTRVPNGDTDSDTPTATGRAKRLVRAPFANADDLRLADFLSSFPCVVYELAPDLTLRLISSNAADLIGIQPEILQGKRTLWDERLFPDERCRLLARLAQLHPKEIVTEQHRMIDDQGLPVWVAHRFQKIGKGSDACIRGFIAPLSRETRAKSFDSALVSHFIHKIGNHFQLINLLVGSLKRSGAATGEIETLQDTIDRAIEFTRAFSHYSQTPVYLAMDLGEVLRAVFHATAPYFGEKKVSYRLLDHESLYGAEFSGDPFLLELALNAIVQNALDATPSGGEVLLTASRAAPKRNGRAIARISVEDTGSGMDKEQLSKAITPFFSSKPERNGIGLSMAIRILENHGGLLNISSQQGYGTRIEILLPLTDIPAGIASESL